MNTISLTGDHLVPVGGSGSPHTVTVVSGFPVNYSTDRTRTAAGVLDGGESVTFDQVVWLWTPMLSAVQVEPAKQATLHELAARQREAEERHAEQMTAIAMPSPAEPKPVWTWQRVSAVVVLGCGWLAGVLGAVGVLH